ncbi:MAG: cytochrome c oxidase subunit 3 [Ignavibacteriaceae bacterium]
MILTEKIEIEQHKKITHPLNPPLKRGRIEKEEKSVRLGLWLFLFSELVLIGGMLILFAVNKIDYEAEFHLASQQLSLLLGSFNTFLLITGSFTVSLSVVALRKEKKYLSLFLLSVTMILAVWFILNRLLELDALWSAGLSLSDEKFLQRVPGEILFFKFFYAMNLVHLIHVVAVILIMKLAAWQVLKGKIAPEGSDKLQGMTVFFHVVTIMWIFFFPLFYLLA